MRKAREMRRLSRRQVCERVKISQRTLVAYEQDARSPRSTVIVALAEALGVTEQWLLTG